MPGTRYHCYTDCPQRGGFKAIVALFLPRTLAARLTVVGIILLSLFWSPVPRGLALTFLGLSAALFVSAGWMANTNLWDYQEKPLYTRGAMPWATAMGSIYALFVVPALLLLLASSGVGLAFRAAFSLQPYESATGWAAIVVIAATVWVLMGVPNQAFKVGLGDKGKGENAQRVLVRLITGIACTLTGLYLFVMHLAGEPLHKLPGPTLAAGIIFTVLLMVPFYQSLATAIWRRGIGDVIGYWTLMQRWHLAGMDVRKALGQSVAAETRVSWLRGVPDDWYDEWEEMWSDIAPAVRKVLGRSADSETPPSEDSVATEKPNQDTGASTGTSSLN